MGLLNYFYAKQPDTRAIDKQTVKLKDPYAQSEYRVDAMETLLKWETPESLLAVLQRFSVVVQSPHWDEEEKAWLRDQLLQKGPLAKSAIIRFIQTATAVTQPLQILQDLCGDPKEYAQLLQQTLNAHPIEDYRGAQAKRELILALQSLKEPKAVDCVCPYLQDPNDDVRCAAIDAICAVGSDTLKQKLLDLLVDTQISPRVLRHTALAVSKSGLTVDQATLPEALLEDYVVRGRKLVPKQG